MTIQQNYSLLPHNTFGIEATARYFITYDSVADLQDTIQFIHSEYPSMPILHIGGGSNLLFLSDYDGIILHSGIKGIDVTFQGDHAYVRVGAAVVWDELVEFCVNNGYYGLENLSLIPGEVGASAVQNIGAYGAEAKDVIESVETVCLQDGATRIFTNGECEYAYRSSIFKHDLKGLYAITHVCFKLPLQFTPQLDYGGIRNALCNDEITPEKVQAKELRNTIINIRNTKLPDPRIQGNAGSFFMNPVVHRNMFEKILKDYPNMPFYEIDKEQVKIPAGWLIEQCGWKGKSLGNAAVHDQQALVLVNKGGAKGKDILRLCETVRSDVKLQFDIDIHPEVNFIGGEA